MGRFRAGLLAAFLGIACIVALGATYTYSRKEAAETISGAWNYIALQNFTGVKFNSTSQAVTPNGMKLDADTGDIETYKGGLVAGRNRGTSWMPPECPAIVGDMGLGFCYDQATGKIKVKDAAGVRDL